jgi:hypothetical protein
MPQDRIEHRLGIATPPDVIWGIISDLAGWSAWNPSYARASGRLSIGAPIALDATFPGVKSMHSEGRIVDWVPDIQLLWRVKLPMFGRSLRYLEIEKLGDTNCIFANGEILEGFGARYVSQRQRAAAYRGFEAMNLAVKARAEQMWRAARQAPTS